MRRVGDELALGGDRFVQRGQHGVEGRTEPADLIVGPGRADTVGEVAGPGDALGGRGELGEGPQDPARGQPGGTVGHARGRDGEPGEEQSRVAQRAIVGVRGPAGAHQPGARLARHGRGVDAELTSAADRAPEVRRLRALGYPDIPAVQRPELSGLTRGHRAREELEFHAAASPAALPKTDRPATLKKPRNR